MTCQTPRFFWSFPMEQLCQYLKYMSRKMLKTQKHQPVVRLWDLLQHLVVGGLVEHHQVRQLLLDLDPKGEEVEEILDSKVFTSTPFSDVSPPHRALPLAHFFLRDLPPAMAAFILASLDFCTSATSSLGDELVVVLLNKLLKKATTKVPDIYLYCKCRKIASLLQSSETKGSEPVKTSLESFLHIASSTILQEYV